MALELKKRGISQEQIAWTVVDRYPTAPGLVAAYKELIEKALLRFPEDKRDDAVLLFSAHSLPMASVGRGDPYVQEVAGTVQAVMEALGYSHSYRLIWQSKV